MLTYEVVVRELPAQSTAVVRAELPPDELGGWLAVAYHAVIEHLRSGGAQAVGPPFARLALMDDVVAAEAGFPVSGEIAGDGYVEPSALPAGTVAMTTHLGRYEELDAAYRSVHDWIAAHGYQVTGPQWEVYRTDPNTEPNPDRWRTDIVVPCRRAGD